MGITVSASRGKGALLRYGSPVKRSGRAHAAPRHRGTAWSSRVTAAVAVCACASAIVVSWGSTNGFAGSLPGTIATIAGTDYPGPSAATSVPLTPLGVAAAGGNLYVTDNTQSVVREVTSTGAQTLTAGNGTYGYSGDGGPATSAGIYDPQSVALEGSGNVVIADSGEQPRPGGRRHYRHLLRPGDDGG